MSDQKTLALTLGERVAALKIFDAFKGSLSTLATLIDDVKNFAVTDAEWTEASLVKTENPDGTENWKWDDTGAPKDITVAQATIDYLKKSIEQKSEQGEITIADTALVTLLAKLV